jgi:hypothetical protein
MAGFLQEMLNAALSDLDDDGELVYDKLSEFEKSRNFVVMAKGPWGAYLKFPMPWGYGAFHALGRNIGGDDARPRHRDRARQHRGRLSSTPSTRSAGRIRSSTSSRRPSCDPIVDLERNRDFANRPIMPDQPEHGTKLPNAQRYWGNVSPHWKSRHRLPHHRERRGQGACRARSTCRRRCWNICSARRQALLAPSSTARPGSSASSRRSPMAIRTSISPSTMSPSLRKLIGQKPVWYDKAAFYARLADVEAQYGYAKGYVGEIKGTVAQPEELRSFVGAASRRAPAHPGGEGGAARHGQAPAWDRRARSAARGRSPRRPDLQGRHEEAEGCREGDHRRVQQGSISPRCGARSRRIRRRAARSRPPAR